jgi:hypothetical protein
MEAVDGSSFAAGKPTVKECCVKRSRRSRKQHSGKKLWISGEESARKQLSVCEVQNLWWGKSALRQTFAPQLLLVI